MAVTAFYANHDRNMGKRKNMLPINNNYVKKRAVTHDGITVKDRNGSCYVESCKLVKISAEKTFQCEVCQDKQVNTFCKSCNLTCCLLCYNYHCRAKLIEGIRNFVCNINDETEMLLGENGTFYMVTNISMIKTQYWYEKILENSFKSVKAHFGSSVELLFDFHTVLQCIFIQDKQGANFYHSYPEFVSIHHVGEIVNLEMTLYACVTIDANGHCEVFCLFLLSKDNEASMSWMCEKMKKYNAKWSKTEILLLDSKIKNVNVFQNFFPDTKILLTALHALNSFKVDLLNFDIGRKEIKNAAKLFKTLLYATSEAQYEKQYEEFCSSFPELKVYFDNVWHKCRQTWALRLIFRSSVLFNPIEKFLDKIGKEITTSVSALYKLEDVIIAYFEIMVGLRQEHFMKISAVFQTAEVISHMKCPQQKYAKLLTCYGGKLMVEQLTLAADVRKLKKIGYGKYEIMNTDVSVTVSHCSCDFYSHLSLPCCHIFAARKSISLPLFSKHLCSSRWFSILYQHSFKLFHAQAINKFNSIFSGSLPCSKFKNWFELLGQLHQHISGTACDYSLERRKIIANLLEAWKYGISTKVFYGHVACFPMLHSNSENILESCQSVDDLVDMYQIVLSSGDEASDEFMSISSCSEVSSMSGF